MDRAMVSVAVASAQISRRDGGDRTSNPPIPNVRGLSVNLVGELHVVCEIACKGLEIDDANLAVRVIFPEDARGLFEFVSWDRLGGVAEVMTQIGVEYLLSLLASGALESCGAPHREADRSGAGLRVAVSSLYVHVALTALASRNTDGGH